MIARSRSMGCEVWQSRDLCLTGRVGGPRNYWVMKGCGADRNSLPVKVAELLWQRGRSRYAETRFRLRTCFFRLRTAEGESVFAGENGAVALVVDAR